MKTQLFLSEKNVKNYLRKQVLPHLNFQVKKIVSVKEITHYTNANYLFKIIVLTNLGQKSFVLKQAQPYNKRYLKQGIKYYVSPLRIIQEVKMLKVLAAIWGQQFVPEVLFFDQKNFAFLMTDVSSGGRLLIEEFKYNKVHPKRGEFFGRLFGRLHASTLKNKSVVIFDRKWEERLIYRLPKKHWGFGLKKFFSAKKINNFFKLTTKIPKNLIWMDPVYRNIFIKKNTVTFVDFDHSCHYDAALQNGIFLAHWVWMMLKGNRKVQIDSQNFIKNYIRAYKNEFLKQPKVTKKDLKEILNRTLSWLGMYLISRTDGKTGSYFREWPEWEAKIREVGIDLFAKNYQKPEVRKIKQLIVN